jgi:hypothetical protein
MSGSRGLEQPRESKSDAEAGPVFPPDDDDDDNDADDGSQPGTFGEVQAKAQSVVIDPGPTAPAMMDEDNPEAWQDDSLPPPPPLDFPAWEWAPQELAASAELPILAPKEAQTTLASHSLSSAPTVSAAPYSFTPSGEPVHLPSYAAVDETHSSFTSSVESIRSPSPSRFETPTGVPPAGAASTVFTPPAESVHLPAPLGGSPTRSAQGDRWVGDEGESPSSIPFAASRVDMLESPDTDARPRMALITLRSSGNKLRDVRRLKRIHGALVSNPGQDHFAFQLFENNRSFKLDFPNETTRLTPKLIAYLVDQAGEGNLQIQ